MCDCNDLFDELAALWAELKIEGSINLREEIMNDIESVEFDLAKCDCGA